MFGAIISALATWLGRTSVLQYLAMKAILYTIIVVILPIVLWNLGVEWVQTILNWVLTQLPKDSAMYTMTGLAGYIGAQLQLPQIISILVSAWITRLIIRMVIR